MLKVRSFKQWQKLHEVWEELSDNYYHFTENYINFLFDNYCIDSGHDYADYIFAIGDIEY